MSVLNPNNMVMLELSRRNDIGSGSPIKNRIALHVETVGISTNKSVPNVPVPLAGAISGESLNLAFDMGLASKTINITGKLTEQNIVKQSEQGSDNEKDVVMTSFELMQLIHSYADSSSLQNDQNISKILFFYPSRVNNAFDQRTKDKDGNTVTAAEMRVLSIDKVPLIPFSWKNRAYDNSFTFGTGNTMKSQSNIFDNISVNNNHGGITGFMRSFSTNIIASEFPTIGYQLDFEEAKVIGDNFFD